MMLLIFTLSLERELATSLCFLQIMSRAFAISESLLMSAFILSMMAFISDVAFLLDVVRLPISDATTEKPLPISPARAASIEAFIPRILIRAVISLMILTIWSVLFILSMVLETDSRMLLDVLSIDKTVSLIAEMFDVTFISSSLM